jgi:hypothetical protein
MKYKERGKKIEKTLQRNKIERSQYKTSKLR